MTELFTAVILGLGSVAFVIGWISAVRDTDKCWPKVVMALFTVTFAACYIGALSVPAHADEAETLYVSPTGSDTNPGTVEAPYATLGAVSDSLCERDCDGLGHTVVVVMAAGTYRGPQGVWRYSDPEYPTKIVGHSVTVDGLLDTGEDNQYGLHIVPENDRSNIEIRSITWTRFARGGIVQAGGGNDLIVDNKFSRIGSYYTKRPDVMAYAGVYWIDVNGSTVWRSTFVDILNTGTGYGHEHAVYIVHSSKNRVLDSKFQNVGGDPIRVRDSSNYNLVKGNTFTSTGSQGYIGDWYCQESRYACPDGDESRSWFNTFKSNTLNGKHPWARSGFRPAYCYDSRGYCSQQRIVTL